MPKAKATHLLSHGVMTVTDSGQWRALCLQKCRKRRRAEGGPETISSTRSASLPLSVYRDITREDQHRGLPARLHKLSRKRGK
jgi:hypothetical protein